MKNRASLLIVASVALLGLSGIAEAQQSNMSFFITSAGPGKGGDLGGLEGADKHCQALAQAAGAGNKTWRAYLSTQAAGGGQAVNARDRIGRGPWQNAKGEVIAQSVDDLHSASNKISKQTGLNEKGEMVNGRGDTPEPARHPHRLPARRPGVSRRRRPDLPQLDEQHPGGGDGRPPRPAGAARRRAVQVVELVTSVARVRGRLQPGGSPRHRGRRPLLLLRRELGDRTVAPFTEPPPVR